MFMSILMPIPHWPYCSHLLPHLPLYLQCLKLSLILELLNESLSQGINYDSNSVDNKTKEVPGAEKSASGHRFVQWERQEFFFSAIGFSHSALDQRTFLPREGQWSAGIVWQREIAQAARAWQTPCYDFVNVSLYLAKCVVSFQQGSYKAVLFNTEWLL